MAPSHILRRAPLVGALALLVVALNAGCIGTASISADGRYVAFSSDAPNLVPGDTNDALDVFVHDRETGTTSRVSVDSAGTQAEGVSGFTSISADGRYVAFGSRAPNLVPGDTNDALDVFVHDRTTGTTSRVSVDSAGSQAEGGSAFTSISADGRYVAFGSAAPNLVPGDTNDALDVFVRDRETGTTSRVNVDSAGTQAEGVSGLGNRDSSISADGRYVAFGSDAPNLVPGDTNDAQDIFVHDRERGTTSRVSVDSAGTQTSTPTAAASSPTPTAAASSPTPTAAASSPTPTAAASSPTPTAAAAAVSPTPSAKTPPASGVPTPTAAASSPTPTAAAAAVSPTPSAETPPASGVGGRDGGSARPLVVVGLAVLAAAAAGGLFIVRRRRRTG